MYRLALLRVQEALVYRFNIGADLFRLIMQVIVLRYLWIALYDGRESFRGVSLEQSLAYITLSMVIGPLFPNSLIGIVRSRLRSGDIVFDLFRPLSFPFILLAQVVGESLSRALTRSLPLLLIISLFIGPAMQTSLEIFVVFLGSMALSFLISFLIDFMFATVGFWMTEIRGLQYLKGTLVMATSGEYLPLWIFPGTLRRILSILPFAYINYTPLSILTNTSSQGVRNAIVFQLVWLVFLTLGAVTFHKLFVRRLSIQGG